MLNHDLQIEGEAKELNNKIETYILYIIAHNGSGFDSYVVLNIRLQWRTVASLRKKTDHAL